MDTRNKQGLTPFQQAIAIGNKNIVNLLELASANPTLISFGSDLFKRRTHIYVPVSQEDEFDKVKKCNEKVISEIKQLWIASKTIKQANKVIRAKMQGQYVLTLLEDQLASFKGAVNGDISTKLVREGELYIKKKKEKEELGAHHYFLFENVLILKHEEIKVPQNTIDPIKASKVPGPTKKDPKKDPKKELKKII